MGVATDCCVLSGFMFALGGVSLYSMTHLDESDPQLISTSYDCDLDESDPQFISTPYDCDLDESDSQLISTTYH